MDSSFFHIYSSEIFAVLQQTALYADCNLYIIYTITNNIYIYIPLPIIYAYFVEINGKLVHVPHTQLNWSFCSALYNVYTAIGAEHRVRCGRDTAVEEVASVVGKPVLDFYNYILN